MQIVLVNLCFLQTAVLYGKRMLSDEMIDW